MGRVRVGVVLAALMLAAAVSVLPVQAANGQSPSTTVVLPRDNGTSSGTLQYFDAIASGATKVTYQLSGGPSDLSDVQIATATLTFVGWAAAWNTTTVANGQYTLQSVASYAGGVSATSAPVNVNVTNTPPTTTILVPANGATVSPGSNLVLDAVASPGVTQVVFDATTSNALGQELNFTGIAATPTIVGWILVIPGQYVQASSCPIATPTSLQSVASYGGGVSGSSVLAIVTIAANDECSI